MFDRKLSSLLMISALVSLVVVSTLTSCGGSSSPIMVTVTAAASTVDGADSTTLTATVENDRNAAGVTWSTTAGTLSNETTTSATLTAPAATSAEQTITVTATSVAEATRTGTATVTVAAKPAVTTTSSSLTGSVGTALSLTLQAGGGIPPYKNWAVYTAGGGNPLPSCLTLSSAGVITTASGTAPTASCAGTYSDLYFQFTDSGTPTPVTATSSALTITITAPSINFTPSLPQGAVGTAYTGSVAATGAVGATTYSVASGALPPDLSLNTSTGAITGAPKAADVGTASFTIKVVDAYGDTATSGSLSISIAAAPAITFGAAPSSTATVGVAYASGVSASGGAGALTLSVASGALPPDLSLNISTGAIAGTPKTADIGTFTFAVKAADAYGDSATSPTYSIVVSYPAVTITPAAGSLPLAVTGQSYSQALTAAGGSGAGYTWTVTGLPANGLSYSASGATLTISGPATATGTVSFTASATDSASNSAGPLSYSIQVYSPVTLPPSNPASLPATATVNLAYSGTISTSGGSGNYSWTVSGLSDGLSSSSSGGTLTITGTPTAAATVAANVSVKDTTTNVTATASYTITVYATVTLPATNPSTLGPAIVSTPYTGTIAAAGGSGNYSWAVTGLPSDGLNYSANGATLTISGTPGATPTTVSFTAKVTDTTTNQSSGPYSYTIGVYNALTQSASGLPLIATVNTAYSGSITASGGSGTGYTWTVTGLSGGLTSSSSGATLTVSGTPTSAAAIQFTVKVTDSAGNTAGPTSYTINAYNALSLPATNPATLGPATINALYSGTIVASGGSGNYSWTVTGLPSDSLSSSANGGTLTISGTPTSATTVSFTASVKDTTTGVTVGPNTYTVTVYSGVTLPTPNPSTLGSADASSTYTGTVVAAGGSGNYSWTITGLPSDGLSYATAGATLTVSGTPTSAQTVSFTAKVTDTSSNQTAGPNTYTITVYGALSLPTPDPSSLPSTGYTGQSYSGSINTSGGSGSYSWSTSGLAGTGLSASPSGASLGISGSPSAAGTISFNVTLTDATTNYSVTQNNYTITVSNPIAVSLPAPSTSIPGSATVGQNYTGSIQASNGVPGYTWYINGTQVTSGYSLGDGITASNTGGSTLSFSGSPASAQTIGPFTVKVTDSTQPANTSATQNYSIVVNTAGGTIGGLFSLQNYCYNGNSNLPVTFTVTLTNTSTNATLTQTTTSSGTYSFTNVPPGTYTITPSIIGATGSLFYPSDPASSTGVTVANGTNLPNENFNVQVAYTVSGTVSYNGSQTGQTYLTLSGGCSNGSGQLGTSISETTLTSGGAYTIRGVQPGSYTLSAWMDPIGNEIQNAIDPTGSNSSVTVSNANVTGVGVTMANPTFATPDENPQIEGIIPNSQGVLIEYSPSKNESGNGIEDANEYLVQWSTSPTLGGGTNGGQFGTISGSHAFPADGDKNVWVLTNAVLAGSGYSFTSGQTYYFQARSYNTLDGDAHPTGWCNYTSSGCSGTTGFIGVTIDTPACTGTCTAVSGTVTIPSGLVCPTNSSQQICAGAPLYLGMLEISPSTGNPTGIYAMEIASPVVGANAFTVSVPSGSNYGVFGILDQLDNGEMGTEAVENVRENLSAGLTISGSSQTVPGVTLPSANSVPAVSTQYNSYNCSGCSSTSTSYQLNFRVEEQNRLPVAVTLTSGPNLLVNNAGTMPVDMSGNCSDCGNTQFGYTATLAGGAPKVGDTYGFTVTYSDGTVETGSVINSAVTAFGSTGAVVGPSDLPTLTSPANGTTAASDQPTFTWTDPALTNPGNYYYSFYLDQSGGSACPDNNCTIWSVPNQNGNYNGFSYTTTSLTWGVDPISGDDSTPSVTSLTSGYTYNWSITVNDSSGFPANQATSSVYFMAP